MKLRMLKLGMSKLVTIKLVTIKAVTIKLKGITAGRRFVIAMVMAIPVTMTAPLAWAGRIVDRVVTSVNGHVVLQSDWEQEVAFEAFSNGRDPDSFTADERNAALDRLIDHELLREQVRPSQPAPPGEVAVRVAEVRSEV